MRSMKHFIYLDQPQKGVGAIITKRDPNPIESEQGRALIYWYSENLFESCDFDAVKEKVHFFDCPLSNQSERVTMHVAEQYIAVSSDTIRLWDKSTDHMKLEDKDLSTDIPIPQKFAFGSSTNDAIKRLVKQVNECEDIQNIEHEGLRSIEVTLHEVIGDRMIHRLGSHLGYSVPLWEPDGCGTRTGATQLIAWTIQELNEPYESSMRRFK